LTALNSSPRGPLILVVDDDEALRNLLGSALEPRGYRVVGCENGRIALDAVAKETPSLIVLDYWMPVVDGAGFMRELRAMLAKRPPVILFTAVQDDAKLARDLGVDVYVEKPVDLHRFLKLVEATMRAGTVRAPSVPPAAPKNFATGSANLPQSAAERRKTRRRALRHEVEVRLAGEARTAPAFIVDLSEGGMSLDLGFQAAQGSHLAIAVILGETRVELDARVRYAVGQRVGVQFVGMDDDRRKALRSLIGT
jgi:DNA-binding response OmpR family regulator